MTDEIIIKSLRCCTEDGCHCRDCAFQEKDDAPEYDCGHRLMTAALELIYRQMSKIEALKMDYDQAMSDAANANCNAGHLSRCLDELNKQTERDCINGDVCLFASCESGKMQTCLHFKSKAEFVHLPCKVGDDVYWTAGVNVPEKLKVFGFEIDEEMNVYLDVGKGMPIDVNNPWLYFNKDEAVKLIKLRQKRCSEKRRGKQNEL